MAFVSKSCLAACVYGIRAPFEDDVECFLQRHFHGHGCCLPLIPSVISKDFSSLFSSLACLLSLMSFDANLTPLSCVLVMESCGSLVTADADFSSLCLVMHWVFVGRESCFRVIFRSLGMPLERRYCAAKREKKKWLGGL